MRSSLSFYTDGAYSWTKNTGGWAFYNPELNIKITNQVKNTTNNRMELTAVLAALQFVILLNLNEFINIIIYTDSLYVKDCCEKASYRHVNLDLFKIYDYFNNLLKNPITFVHVKGHSNIKENNTVDLLANKISNL